LIFDTSKVDLFEIFPDSACCSRPVGGPECHEDIETLCSDLIAGTVGSRFWSLREIIIQDNLPGVASLKESVGPQGKTEHIKL